jgi:hypothetical protein
MRLNAVTYQTDASGSTLTALRKVAEQMGRSSITLWRWRKKGWLETVNISGKPYVSADGLAKFNRRAAAGEFAKTPFVPSRACSHQEQEA